MGSLQQNFAPLNIAPQTVTELLARAQILSGHRIRELEGLFPEALQGQYKGRAGRLIELFLGVANATGSGPDFPESGVELKTIPIGATTGRPLESTFVTTIPIERPLPAFERSNVWRKMKCILFVPIESHRGAGARQDGVVREPFIWCPDATEQRTLSSDWTEISDHIELHGEDGISASVGTWLHVRPKAASNRARHLRVDINFAPRLSYPHGIYLRATKTAELLGARQGFK